jgi:chaperonin GroEL
MSFTKVTKNNKGLLKGISLVEGVVEKTLGAKGSYVSIETMNGQVHITKDGITAARSVNPKDPEELMGAQLISQAGARAERVSQDGTTSSIVLCGALCKQSNKLVKAGKSPVWIQEQLETLKKEVNENLEKIKMEASIEDISRIASISANGEKVISDNLVNIFKKQGANASINVQFQNSMSLEDSVVYVDGYEYDSGMSYDYILAGSGEPTKVINNPYVLILTERVKDWFKSTDTPLFVKMLLDKISKEGKTLLLLHDAVTDTTVSHFANNWVKSVISNVPNLPMIACVKINMSLNETETINICDDIATYVGGKVLSVHRGATLESLSENKANVGSLLGEYLGTCGSVEIGREKVTFFGTPFQANVDERIAELERTSKELEKKQGSYQEIAQGRINRLRNDIATYYVGGETDAKRKERKDRVDDAIGAIKSALEYGYVIGGGKSLMNCIDKVSVHPTLRKALLAPINTIMRNANIKRKVTGVKIWDNLFGWDYNNDVAYNAKTGKKGSLIEMGIIDPVKVVKTSINVACDVASVVINTAAVISLGRED